MVYNVYILYYAQCHYILTFHLQNYNYFSYLCAHEIYFHIIYDNMVLGKFCHAQI